MENYGQLRGWAAKTSRFVVGGQASPADFDDIVQECLIAGWKATVQYDPAKPASLKTYIILAMRRAAMRWLRLHRRRGFGHTNDSNHAKKKLPPPVVSRLREIEPPERETVSMEDIEDRAWRSSAIRRKVSFLPPDLRLICDGLLGGLSFTAISIQNGRRAGWAKAMLYNSRPLLKREMAD